MENNNSSVPKPQRSREGNLNPMFGKRQSPETKQKISNSQKERYEKIRQELQSESVKVDNVEQDAKLDLLKQWLFTDSIKFRDAQQAHNFIDIMATGIDSTYLRRVINDELNQHLTNINKHV